MGWWFLFRQARWRPLGMAALVTFLVFLIVGKAYYPGPLIPVLLAAGCVQLERSFGGRVAAVAGAAMVLQAILTAPLTMPVVPQSALAHFGLDQPADVLTTALYTRFRSRREHTFAEKVLSAMRQKFGGHKEPPPGQVADVPGGGRKASDPLKRPTGG